jgi:hypothetical protein
MMTTISLSSGKRHTFLETRSYMQVLHIVAPNHPLSLLWMVCSDIKFSTPIILGISYRYAAKHNKHYGFWKTNLFLMMRTRLKRGSMLAPTWSYINTDTKNMVKQNYLPTNLSNPVFLEEGKQTAWRKTAKRSSTSSIWL